MNKEMVTTGQLFTEIVEELRKKELLPDILDYALAERFESEPIWDSQFEPILELKYGGSEGIYLDVFIRGCFRMDGKESRAYIGCFKTLYECSEALHIMANLYADFLIECHAWCREHRDDLERKGVKILFYKDRDCKEKLPMFLHCDSVEDASEVLKKESPKTDYVAAEFVLCRTLEKGSFLKEEFEADKDLFYRLMKEVK